MEREASDLCMDEWNRPTPVRRRLSLTQAARGLPGSTFTVSNDLSIQLPRWQDEIPRGTKSGS